MAVKKPATKRVYKPRTAVVKPAPVVEASAVAPVTPPVIPPVIAPLAPVAVPGEPVSYFMMLGHITPSTHAGATQQYTAGNFYVADAFLAGLYAAGDPAVQIYDPAVPKASE